MGDNVDNVLDLEVIERGKSWWWLGKIEKLSKINIESIYCLFEANH